MTVSYIPPFLKAQGTGRAQAGWAQARDRQGTGRLGRGTEGRRQGTGRAQAGWGQAQEGHRQPVQLPRG